MPHMEMYQSFYSFVWFERMGGPFMLVDLNEQHCSSTSTKIYFTPLNAGKLLCVQAHQILMLWVSNQLS